MFVMYENTPLLELRLLLQIKLYPGILNWLQFDVFKKVSHTIIKTSKNYLHKDLTENIIMNMFNMDSHRSTDKLQYVCSKCRFYDS